MNLFDAITSRVSVKKFEKTLVDDKLIGVILYMGTNAPSAGNVQPWEFIIVKDEDTKKRLYEAAIKQEQVRDAPLDIIVCADLKKASSKYQERGEVLYSIQDTAGVITIMMITANALGLGSYWVRAFDEEFVKEIVNLPKDLRPVGIISIGYPKEKPEKEELIPFERLAWFDKYRQKYHISEFFQPGPRQEVFKPVGNQLIEAIKKYRKK
jgi:nitroreductase